MPSEGMGPLVPTAAGRQQGGPASKAVGRADLLVRAAAAAGVEHSRLLQTSQLWGLEDCYRRASYGALRTAGLGDKTHAICPHLALTVTV